MTSDDESPPKTLGTNESPEMLSHARFSVLAPFLLEPMSLKTCGPLGKDIMEPC